MQCTAEHLSTIVEPKSTRLTTRLTIIRLTSFCRTYVVRGLTRSHRHWFLQYDGFAVINITPNLNRFLFEGMEIFMYFKIILQIVCEHVYSYTYIIRAVVARNMLSDKITILRVSKLFVHFLLNK